MTQKNTFKFHVLDIKVIDGDSYNVTIDLGVKCRWQGNLRLIGLNCPEARGEESVAGKAVKKWSENFIHEVNKDSKMVVVANEFDKFGRLLGDIEFYYNSVDPMCCLPETRIYSLSNIMLRKNYAKPYYGNTVRPKFDAREVLSIVESIKINSSILLDDIY